jgi:hypothetical protein
MRLKSIEKAKNKNKDDSILFFMEGNFKGR